MSKRDKQKEIQKNILKKLQNNGHKSYRPKELAKQLGYSSSPVYRTFRSVLQDLVRKGAVHRVKGNRFSLKRESLGEMEGVLRVSRDGYGFVEVVGKDEDIFIPRNRIRTALDGDNVRILVHGGSSSDDRNHGEIIEVTGRNTQRLTGTTKVRGGTVYIIPDDVRFNKNVYIHESESQGLRSGEKVVVELGEFDSFRNAFRSTLLEALGDSQNPEVLMLALIRHFNLPTSFPENVEEASLLPPERIPSSEIRRRLDLRDKQIFTIDPDDAKDFDDAIHVTPLEGDRYEIGVHIADVSYYVEQDETIDREALTRSTSVYLADRVIPMLPERLSNNLCSLRPGEDKLTFSCILEVDLTGRVHNYQFHETVIHSKQRFTYQEAQDIIDRIQTAHPLAETVLKAAEIADVFTKKRFQEGSVEFDLPEIRVRLDESGNPLEILRKEIKASNRLIEEFMLLANQCAALSIEKLKPSPKPFIYRVHDRPNEERIQQLVTYMRTFGLEITLEEGNMTSTRLNTLLKKIKGTNREPIVKTAALRAMAKACYSNENIGHYGLGFTHYSHFTSPIRRYPDLIAHRLLKHYLFGHSYIHREPLEALSDHCSLLERKAEEAERASIRQKQVLMAEKRLGEHFDGIITSVTKFGLFVQLNDLWLEGLVHVRDMLDDYYEFDPNTFSLSGSHTGISYQAGKTLKVQLAKANPDTREIELVIA